jgi:hypothetical protein
VSHGSTSQNSKGTKSRRKLLEYIVTPNDSPTAEKPRFIKCVSYREEIKNSRAHRNISESLGVRSYSIFVKMEMRVALHFADKTEEI